jgi:hypothetical protein
MGMTAPLAVPRGRPAGQGRARAATGGKACVALMHLISDDHVYEDPMARNRFEQVDELQPDAINLTLIQKSDGHVAIVHCPKTVAPDELPVDLTSAEMPLRDAVIGAIELANSKKIPIVVIDRDNLWNSEWGDLWRYEEGEEG